jgi:ribose transport system permease protein
VGPKEILGRPEFSVLVVLLSLSLVTSALNPFFYSVANLQLILIYASIMILVGLGQMLVVIVGGFDMSVSALVMLSNVMVAAFYLWLKFPIWLAIVASVALTVGLGFAQGLFTVTFSPPFPFIAPAFIITLAMNFIVPGLMLVLTGGVTITGMSTEYRIIGQGYVFGVSVPVLLTIAVLIVMTYLLHFNRLGVHMYAIGGNDEFARRAGINVRRVRLIAFTLAAAIYSLVGLILGSQMSGGSIHAGPYYLIPSMVAPFLGGARFGGGEGTTVGVILGGTVIYLVENMLVALSIDPFWHQPIIGTIFLLVLSFDFMRRKRALLGERGR